MSTEDCALCTIEEQLGTPEQLADAAETNYRGATLPGRHPEIAFLIAPIPVTVLGWAAYLLLLGGLFALLPYVPGGVFRLEGKTVDQWPAVAVWGAWSVHYVGKFVPPALVAGLFCLMAHRGRVRPVWALLACALVALVAAAYHSSLVLPVEPGKGRYAIGLGLGLCMFRPTQLLQLATPLAVGLAFAWHARTRSTDPAEPSQA